jgi:hypothetical protein
VITLLTNNMVSSSSSLSDRPVFASADEALAPYLAMAVTQGEAERER